MSTIKPGAAAKPLDKLPLQGLEALLELLGALRGRLRDGLRDQPGVLAPMHQRMLRHCLQNPGANQQALAQASGRDKGQIARLIKELETQGLLVREADPGDGRMQRLKVTAAGRAAHQRFRKQEAVIAQQMFEAMTAAEIEGLIRQLGRLRDSLRAAEARPELARPGRLTRAATGRPPAPKHHPAMCANYIPVTRADRLLAFFGVTRARDEPPVDIYPTGLAPFIRLAEDGSGNKLVEDGAFGLLPHFAKEVAYGRRTYNARSETVDRLASFRDSWAAGRRCIVPAETIFEVCWETGEAVRWAIEHPGQAGMAVAGLYRKWRGPEGRELFSFAMLTVNADGHPIFQRMHRPGEEKRMVVILESDEHDAWLTGTPDEARRFFHAYAGPLVAHPAPRPKRAPTSSSVRSHRPPSRDTGPDLFET